MIPNVVVVFVPRLVRVRNVVQRPEAVLAGASLSEAQCGIVRYPKCESVINFLCCCNSAGEPRPNIQLVINSSKYMLDFIGEYPPDFQISAKCCDYCKKQIAHQIQKNYDMIIISTPYFFAAAFTWSLVAFISRPVLKNTYLIGGRFKPVRARSITSIMMSLSAPPE